MVCSAEINAVPKEDEHLALVALVLAIQHSHRGVAVAVVSGQTSSRQGQEGL